MANAIKYLLKKRVTFIIVLTVILLLISFLGGGRRTFIDYYWLGQIKPGSDSYIDVPSRDIFDYVTIIAGILCTVTPIFDFRFKMRKVNIDQMYSLPIKREKLYLSHFIVGFISILIPVTVLLFEHLFNILLSNHMYNLIYFIPFYFSLVAVMLLLYSIFAFLFTRANTMIDGIVTVVAGIFIVLMIAGVIETVTGGFEINRFLIWYPLSYVNDFFTHLSIYEEYTYLGVPLEEYSMLVEEIVSLIIFIIEGVVAFVLFVILNKKEKAENCMQISNSWFSYKIMIPAYFSLFIMFCVIDGYETIAILFLIIAAYVGYVIYKRSFRLKKWDYIIIASCFVGAIVLGLVLDSVEEVLRHSIKDYYSIMPH